MVRSDSQITVCRSQSRPLCAISRLRKILELFCKTYGHCPAGFSTPTLGGNFTLEENLPVIIFSYEPSGQHPSALHLRFEVLPRFRDCKPT